MLLHYEKKYINLTALTNKDKIRITSFPLNKDSIIVKDNNIVFKYKISIYFKLSNQACILIALFWIQYFYS
jgi:hypothetical protein